MTVTDRGWRLLALATSVLACLVVGYQIAIRL
jgi:hypothetical protein